MAIPAPLSVDNLQPVFGSAEDSAGPTHCRGRTLAIWLRRVGCFVLVIGLVACGSKPAAPEKIEMEFRVSASARINPDVNGRSSPVVLVIMQLRSQDKFAAADFFSLYDPGAAMLGDDLLGRDQLTVVPDSKRTIPMELDPDTQFIGVVAAFSNLEQAAWRDVAEIPEKGLMDKVRFFTSDRTHIALDELSVSISFGSD